MKMKHLLFFLLAAALCSCVDDNAPQQWTHKWQTVRVVEPTLSDGKQADITYQLLVYSFADSNGDGIGDLKGITQHLDYLDETLGASALWLSPLHPASSYHGYDVTNYDAVNSSYGTDDDLRELIAEARKRGIRIYLDMVLNHTSNAHPWFRTAVADERSPYRDYYHFSLDPAADIAAGCFPMIEPTGYEPSQWIALGGNAGYTGRLHFFLDWGDGTRPTVTVTETTQEPYAGSGSSAPRYLYFGDGSCLEMRQETDVTYSLVTDFSSDWGFLVRTSATQWDGNTKWGATSSAPIVFGQPFALCSSASASNVANIVFSQGWKYHSHFTSGVMPDLNYGAAATASSSPVFKEMMRSCRKWIDMGVAGFRLDAVKHIYHDASSGENPLFLRQFYDACNAAWHASPCYDGTDFYMVGEMWDSPAAVAPYYEGLPALFDFAFWDRLQDAIKTGTGRTLFSTLRSYRNLYASRRPDFIEATKLSNHDENRVGSVLGRNTDKMKLAAAVLLTADGSPYVYQGEELGYWGTKDKGDEYVRTPIQWNADGSGRADRLMSGKIDREMLSADIAVQSQLHDDGSVLDVYRRFALARNASPALAHGRAAEHPYYHNANPNANSIACWYRVSDDDTALVLHNFSSKAVTLTIPDAIGAAIVCNGEVRVKADDDTFLVEMPGYSSVVFPVEN